MLRSGCAGVAKALGKGAGWAGKDFKKGMAPWAGMNAMTVDGLFGAGPAMAFTVKYNTGPEEGFSVRVVPGKLGFPELAPPEGGGTRNSMVC